MKNIYLSIKIIWAILLFYSFSSYSIGDVYVREYTKSNGTVVKGHYRSSPDGTINNNFSTKGNVNPYTGKEGTITPENIETRLSRGSVNNIKRESEIDVETVTKESTGDYASIIIAIIISCICWYVIFNGGIKFSYKSYKKSKDSDWH